MRAGGQVIGVTCAVFDPLPSNLWLTEEIKAPTMLERLAIMLDRATGYVAVRGGIGTLSEVTLAWSLLQTRSQVGKQLVLLGADWQPVLDAFRQYTDLGSSMAALVSCCPHPGPSPTGAYRAPDTAWPATLGGSRIGAAGRTDVSHRRVYLSHQVCFYRSIAHYGRKRRYPARRRLFALVYRCRSKGRNGRLFAGQRMYGHPSLRLHTVGEYPRRIRSALQGDRPR